MAEIKEIKISAKEARQLVETSPILLNRVYKNIKEAAREGASRLDWNVSTLDNATIKKLIDSLKSDGFSVSLHGPLNVIDTLTITW